MRKYTGRQKESQTSKWFTYAKKLWYTNYPCYPMDLMVDSFLGIDATTPTEGWLRGARQALLLSTGEVAKRLKVSRSAYAALEVRAIEGNVTLKALKQAAEVMECELVYAIRPKRRVRFSEIIWSRLTKDLSLQGETFTKIKAHALLTNIAVKIRSPDFRRKQKWTEVRLQQPNLPTE